MFKSIRNLFGSIADRRARQKRRASALPKRYANLGVERLEERALMAADLTALIEGTHQADTAEVRRMDSPQATGVKSAPSEVTVVTPELVNRILTIRGTKNADTINVTTASGNINVAGKSYSSSKVDIIVIVAESGNDTIRVAEAITKSTRIFGGSGDDTIEGGGGADEIYGAGGRDTIKGRGGNDTIYGGDGVDTLVGGAGTDSVYQGSPSRTYSMNSVELEIVRLTNLERTSRGLKALTTSSLIANAAALHAYNMATRSNTVGDSAAHNHVLYGVKLPTPSSRMDYAGYDWTSRSENIAYGQRTAQAVVTAWMNSPGHKANILATDITSIGVAVRTNAQGTRFYCQNFGRA